MPKTLYINGRAVKAVAVNGQNVKAIGDGVNTLWEQAQPDYFYFEDRSGEVNAISITKTGDQTEWLSLEYSTNKETWTTWDFSQTLTLPANGRVYLKGNNTYGFGINNTNYHAFNCTGDYAVGGDVWSIMSENVSSISSRFMTRTFQNSATLVDCSQLSITNLPIRSTPFTWTFASCTNLTSVMESIPSTYFGASGDNSEFYMLFNGSYSLANFPTFPNITSLNKNGMRAIASASNANPNTTLTYVDLSNIETVYTQALYQAFIHCKALEVVKIGISAWGDFEDSTSDYYDTTNQWLVDVHSTGVFCKNSTLPVTRGGNYIPNNWSIADLNGKLYAPVITENSGTITIAEAEGGTSCQIYYTTDGTTPTTNSTLYTQPFTVAAGTTVKAVAHYNGQSAALVTDSDAAVLVGQPTLSYSNKGTGGGAQGICTGNGYQFWKSRIKTTGVEGVTYYINYQNSATSDSYPSDPTTNVYDVTATYSGQTTCEEADSEVLVQYNVCNADLVGDYLNIAVIGVLDGNISEVAYLSMDFNRQ